METAIIVVVIAVILRIYH